MHRHTLTLGLAILGMVSVLFADEAESEPDPCFDLEWLSMERFSLNVDFLYWKATEDNLAFGIRQKIVNSLNPVTSAGTGTDRAKKKELDFKWRPGVRILLNYALPCEPWDLGFLWTHQLNHATGSANAPNASSVNIGVPGESGTILGSTFLVPNAFTVDNATSTNFNAIDAHWHLNFTDYQWLVGRLFDITCDFILHPFVGLKLTDIKQRYHLDYVLNPDLVNPANRFGSITQRIRTSYSGFGIQGGLDADWQVGNGFSLYSTAGAGITYGRAHIHETMEEIVNIPAEGIQTLDIAFRDTVRISRPNVDFSIGLRWDLCFACHYLMTLNAAWEYHHYFDQNLFRFAQANDPGRGSLNLHGWMVGIGLSF